MRRWIMHVDMDAFFASVEQLDHPEYRGHPVIVGGLSARGVVSTASYEARKFGVHSAMSMEKARKLCPNGIFLWPNFDRYKEISCIIHDVMKEFTPHIEPLSLDEAFLEVTGMSTLYDGPYQLGRAIKERVFERTGLIISAGLAPNKFLAKLASDLDKPDGLVVIPYGKEVEALKNLPIERIWGVGRHTAKRFHEASFHKIGDIQALPDEKELILICGNQSKRIYDLAHGIDDRPVEVDRQVQSVGNEETYEADITDPTAIDLEFRYFAHRVAKRLRKYGLAGHTVAIKIRFNDFSALTRQKKLDNPTDQEEIIYETSQLLYNKLTITKPIRLLGITVSGFQEDEMIQESLFSESTDTAHYTLSGVLDELETKFGDGVIMKGSLWERNRSGIGDHYRKDTNMISDDFDSGSEN